MKPVDGGAGRTMPYTGADTASNFSFACITMAAGWYIQSVGGIPPRDCGRFCDGSLLREMICVTRLYNSVLRYVVTGIWDAYFGDHVSTFARTLAIRGPSPRHLFFVGGAWADRS